MSTRWKIPRKPCPVSGCVEPIRRDRLMCSAHWRLVPKDLKRTNRQTNAAFLRYRSAATARAFIENRDACVAAVEDVTKAGPNSQ